jgi:hypothetical protein
MPVSRTLAAVLGGIVVLGVWSSVVRTLVVPRGLRSKLVALVQKGTLGAFDLLARPFRAFETRDTILAWAAPLSILFSLAVWLLGFLLGYALLIYGVSSLPAGAALREAGSSLFTLGFASGDRTQLTLIDLLAAATGPIVIGLLVGYLPTLYAAYSRRETDVTMLEARAGEPNWGPEILARHASVESLDNLEPFFQNWERWAADISESHTNYPVLIHVRSARPSRNWLVGMVSVMDAAAMQLALAPQMRQSPARMALRMGFVCLRDLAGVEGIAFDPDPDPDGEITLTYDEFLLAVERLEEAGFPIQRPPAEAWPHFCGWRINYESIAYQLADDIDAVPALWTGPRRVGRTPMAPRTPQNRQPGGAVGGPRAGE